MSWLLTSPPVDIAAGARAAITGRPDRAFFGTGSSISGQSFLGAQAEIVQRAKRRNHARQGYRPRCDEAAILIGDNLATGWAAVERGDVRPGDTVAIIGGGAVGQLASLSAQVAGASVVVVIEPSERRRQFARANGALGVPPEGAPSLVSRLTQGDGFDVVIEAVGSSGPLRAAFDLVRKRGRIVSVGAHASEEWQFPLAKSFANELTLSFAIGDSIRLRPRLSSLIGTGVLDPTVVIDARITFSEAVDTYRDLRHRKS